LASLEALPAVQAALVWRIAQVEIAALQRATPKLGHDWDTDF
jgi:hypothetical protein